MIQVALSLVGGWALSIAVLVRALERARREHSRREDLLVNQLLHAVDRPWQPAPADDLPPLPTREPDPWVGDAEQVIV